MKENERERKTWQRGNGKTQKMMSFRLDSELIVKMDAVKNKGRLINKLLSDYFAAGKNEADDDPSWHALEDNMP